MSMYSPLAIANTIIERKPGLTLLQLNKLVYLVQGFSLALRNPLVGELPLAFDYGPDYVSLACLRFYGEQPIKRPQPLSGTETVLVVPSRDSDAHRIINEIVDQYGRYKFWQLSALTHSQGTPWADLKASDPKAFASHAALPELSIRKYFIGLVAAAPTRRAA